MRLFIREKLCTGKRCHAILIGGGALQFDIFSRHGANRNAANR